MWEVLSVIISSQQIMRRSTVSKCRSIPTRSMNSRTFRRDFLYAIARCRRQSHDRVPAWIRASRSSFCLYGRTMSQNMCVRFRRQVRWMTLAE
jgi:hypothetical protein